MRNFERAVHLEYFEREKENERYLERDRMASAGLESRVVEKLATGSGG